MRNRLGIVLLAIVLALTSLHTQAQTDSTTLYFFPDTVVRGEPFVAYTVAGNPPDELTFNPDEPKPFRQFKLAPVSSCGYLSTSFGVAEPPLSPASASCYIMPMNALGGSPLVRFKSASGVITIIGQSLQKGSGVSPVVSNDLTHTPVYQLPGLSEIPNELVPLNPDQGYEVLYWTDGKIPTGVLFQAAQNTGFIAVIHDVLKPVLAGGSNLAPTCNGELGYFTFLGPFGLVNALFRQEVLKLNPGLKLSDLSLHLQSNPWPTLSQPQTFGLGGNQIQNFPASIHRPTLPVSSNPSGYLAIVDSGISNFSGHLKKGLNTLVATSSVPVDPTDTKDDFDIVAPYAIKPGGGVGLRVKGHGSIVAEIAAGKNGIDPNAIVTPVKACDKNGACPLESIITGVCYAINAVEPKGVVNLSLGGDTESEILSAIINEAAAQNITFVASAGNNEQLFNNGFVGVPMQFPAATQKRKPNQRLANNTQPLEQMIGVGAVGQYQGTKWDPADFSQRGKYVDIAAPGVNLVMPGMPDPYFGTSFAAPFVSGAVLLAQEKDLTRSWVLGKGCKAKRPNNKPALGCGILDLSRLPR